VRLYRGINLSMERAVGGLKPKGNVAEQGWAHDSGHHYDTGLQYDITESNGVFLHQHKKQSYPNSAWISTTPNFEQAREYALHEFVDDKPCECEEGVVYVFDPARFAEFGVVAWEVARVVSHDSALGQRTDDEYAIRANPPGDLPEGIVVERIKVFRDP
jgi:hypothetical protein